MGLRSIQRWFGAGKAGAGIAGVSAKCFPPNDVRQTIQQQVTPPPTACAKAMRWRPWACQGWRSGSRQMDKRWPTRIVRIGPHRQRRRAVVPPSGAPGLACTSPPTAGCADPAPAANRDRQVDDDPTPRQRMAPAWQSFGAGRLWPRSDGFGRWPRARTAVLFLISPGACRLPRRMEASACRIPTLQKTSGAAKAPRLAFDIGQLNAGRAAGFESPLSTRPHRRSGFRPPDGGACGWPRKDPGRSAPTWRAPAPDWLHRR